MTNALMVFVGGGAGSVLRYLIGTFFRTVSISLPVATLVSNITSCLIFALIVTAQKSFTISPAISNLLLAGFCGGLSTFSTFSHETFLLLKQGESLYAILNIGISVSVCVLIFFLAHRTAS